MNERKKKPHEPGKIKLNKEERREKSFSLVVGW